jgi:2-iminobutanoate/2-iminopropanoate deaminase
MQDPAAPRLAAYSTAVAAQGLVFISGVVPVVPETGKLAGEDLDSQVKRALANLERALSLSGSKREDVVKVTVFLKNPADFPAMNRIYAAFFGDRLPARTTVPGADWGNAFLVEIEAVAVDRRPAGACPTR